MLSSFFFFFFSFFLIFFFLTSLSQEGFINTKKIGDTLGLWKTLNKFKVGKIYTPEKAHDFDYWIKRKIKDEKNLIKRFDYEQLDIFEHMLDMVMNSSEKSNSCSEKLCN